MLETISSHLNQSVLRHFLAECIAPRTTGGRLFASTSFPGSTPLFESGVDPGNEVVFAWIPVRMIYLVIVFCSDLLLKRYEGDCA